MADYKELLRKAIAALPENNGAARRAVYEKARSALVAQLRAIQPPLAARDITTHRLQLEDGIRQVEQEASEALIAKLEQPLTSEAAARTARASAASAAAAAPAPAKSNSIEELIAADETPEAGAEAEPEFDPQAAFSRLVDPDVPPKKPIPAPKLEPKPAKAAVIAAPDEPEAEAPEEELRVEEKPATKPSRPLPSIVARAEAAKARGTTAFGVPASKPSVDKGRNTSGRPGPTIEPRREAAASSRIEPTMIRGEAVARQAAVDPLAFEAPVVSAAMSSVREVEVEPALTADPQGAIDRAIATLDREARGEVSPVLDEPATEDLGEDDDPIFGKPAKAFPDPVRPRKRDGLDKRAQKRDREERSPFVRDGAAQRAADPDRGGISALTIFLFVFVILLAGVGGAGFWAWREGYVDLDALFASNAPASTGTETPAGDTPVATAATDTTAVTGPGNTAPTELTPIQQSQVPPTDTALVVDDRLTASPTTPEVVAPLALVPPDAAATTEERIPADGPAQPQTAEQAIAAVNPASIAGSQSLLLEAADDGTNNAIPFSGTVEWTRGTDELGLPTLIGRANIPARNMGVELLIRKNSDPTLPASHLMEINFNVSETFIGGSVAGLPGVLLKNEELVNGSPLIGASARVVGNSFLFALSASPDDATANNALMVSRKWMDIAIIYATGKRAILTLEKDPDAQTLFNEVFDAWGASTT